MALYRSYRSQQGVVLIVSLIMLLIMTLIGAATMQNSTLQERMAGNAKQKLLADLSAQSGLKAAEEYLTAQAFVTENRLVELFAPVTGHYNFKKINTTVVAKRQTIDVRDASVWNDTNSIEVTGLSAGVTARNPRYTIEYLGASTSGVNDQAKELPTLSVDKPYIFRVTSIGWAQDINIYTVLESTFVSAP